jgi:hypothetical protein
MTREAFLIAFLRSLADDFGVCGSRYEVAAEYLREAADWMERAALLLRECTEHMEVPESCADIYGRVDALIGPAQPPDTPDTAPPAL